MDVWRRTRCIRWEKASRTTEQSISNDAILYNWLQCVSARVQKGSKNATYSNPIRWYHSCPWVYSQPYSNAPQVPATSTRYRGRWVSQSPNGRDRYLFHRQILEFTDDGTADRDIDQESHPKDGYTDQLPVVSKSELFWIQDETLGHIQWFSIAFDLCCFVDVTCDNCLHIANVLNSNGPIM